jgi:hypothetical protein
LLPSCVVVAGITQPLFSSTSLLDLPYISRSSERTFFAVASANFLSPSPSSHPHQLCQKTRLKVTTMTGPATCALSSLLSPSLPLPPQRPGAPEHEADVALGPGRKGPRSRRRRSPRAGSPSGTAWAASTISCSCRREPRNGRPRPSPRPRAQRPRLRRRAAWITHMAHRISSRERSSRIRMGARV